jgi:hypothetical protein
MYKAPPGLVESTPHGGERVDQYNTSCGSRKKGAKLCTWAAAANLSNALQDSHRHAFGAPRRGPYLMKSPPLHSPISTDLSPIPSPQPEIRRVLHRGVLHLFLFPHSGLSIQINTRTLYISCPPIPDLEPCTLQRFAYVSLYALQVAAELLQERMTNRPQSLTGKHSAL